MSYGRCSVVWTDDPFKDDEEAGRPWLVLNNDEHPFEDEQVMAVALTTSGYEEAVEIQDKDWESGGVPFQSYVLPWAVHSPMKEDIDKKQGELREDFVDRVVEELVRYIE